MLGTNSWYVLLLVWTYFWSVWSDCNYVAQLSTGISWSTGVCIPMGPTGRSLGYMKFSCPTSSDPDPNSIYFELYTNPVCDIGHFVSRKILNATTDPYVFDCDGTDGCYVSYLQGCDGTQRTQLVMSPVDTCVTIDPSQLKKKNNNNTNNNIYSYKFTCDDSEMLFTSFSNGNCDETDLNTVTPVFGCSEIPAFSTSWQFEDCQNSQQMTTGSADSNDGRKVIVLKNITGSDNNNNNQDSNHQTSGDIRLTFCLFNVMLTVLVLFSI